jgi:hypothetical protein
MSCNDGHQQGSTPHWICYKKLNIGRGEKEIDRILKIKIKIMWLKIVNIVLNSLDMSL